MDMETLGEMEERFAELIWANAPAASGELVKLCEQQFGWKKSTTYTMLKRLCARGLFRNERGTVYACSTQEEYRVRQGERFLKRSFGGSLPGFVAAFTRKNRLSAEEVDELRRLIETYDDGQPEKEGKQR